MSDRDEVIERVRAAAERVAQRMNLSFSLDDAKVSRFVPDRSSDQSSDGVATYGSEPSPNRQV
jgi:hypothetical protein